MHYFLLLIAFLTEIILKPHFNATNYNIEFIIIIYFAILFRTNHAVSVVVPAILIIIVNILTNTIVGMQSLSLLITMLIYNIALTYINQKQQTYNTIKKITSIKNSIIIFTILFFVITLIQTIFLKIYNYNLSFVSQIICYFMNIFIFTLCLIFI